MYLQKRFREALIIVDTCQASTLFDHFHTPNVIGISSSLKGESSYSLFTDPEIGIAVSDRFSYNTAEFMKSVNQSSSKTLQDFMAFFNFRSLQSHVSAWHSLYPKSLESVRGSKFWSEFILPYPILNALLAEADHHPQALSSSSETSRKRRVNGGIIFNPKRVSNVGHQPHLVPKINEDFLRNENNRQFFFAFDLNCCGILVSLTIFVSFASWFMKESTSPFDDHEKKTVSKKKVNSVHEKESTLTFVSPKTKVTHYDSDLDLNGDSSEDENMTKKKM